MEVHCIHLAMTGDDNGSVKREEWAGFKAITLRNVIPQDFTTVGNER